jgi:hypothetical protein
MSGSGHERPNETIDFESALTSNVLQNYFERRSEEYPFKVTHQCGILIQKSAPSDSILARC